MKETFTSLQEEVEMKTKKLEKVNSLNFPIRCYILSFIFVAKVEVEGSPE